jgi:uncharacterized protein (DUF2336 family)
LNAIPSSGPITYEQAKALARDPDPAVRMALAARSDLTPEILYFLAEDESSDVRRIVAANRAAPRQADVLLARDADGEVRSGLAAKICKLAPGLGAHERDKVRQATYETLEALARDQLTVVRQVLSEALKDVADAPPEIIKTLALDTAIEVAGPVLRFSPVLTDEDLIEIIGSSQAQGALGAISRRDGVGAGVADAIVAANDVEAIASLLANPSAQMREETLDGLIERAPSVALWHAPLAARPKLQPKAASKLARFLADSLLETLQARTDLDAGTLDAVKSAVRQRIGAAADGLPESAGEGAKPVQDFLAVEPPIDMARRMLEARRLDQNVIARALNAGDHAFVLASLIVRSGVDLKVARRIFIEKSAKGVTALAWKASLPMRLAVLIQQRMARIAPSDLVKAAADGGFPIDENELNWHLEFYRDLAKKVGG